MDDANRVTEHAATTGDYGFAVGSCSVDGRNLTGEETERLGACDEMPTAERKAAVSALIVAARDVLAYSRRPQAERLQALDAALARLWEPVL